MLKVYDEDTIVAISTPPGEGGIGVVRLSGKKALEIADGLFRSKSRKPVSGQRGFTAQYGHVFSRLGGEATPIDEVLLLVMRAPKSYTTEDVVEISAHGGQAVLQAIVEEALCAGARLAEKGEFTKRAFLNGRIDLLQAEAVLDLIKAKTGLGREWAAAQLEGALSRKIKEAKQTLLSALAQVEASIDFPDENLETAPSAQIAQTLANVEQELAELLESSALGFLAKRGVRVAIAGRPNVGKSSLMNALCKSNRVIVTPYPGTTRDVIEEEIQLKGFPVRLCDTAGIHGSDHPVEKEGIERTKLAVSEADLVLYVLDSSEPFHAEDQELLGGLGDKRRILVLNKADLPRKLSADPIRLFLGYGPAVESSCIKERGVQKLEDALYDLMTDGTAAGPGDCVLQNARQKDLLEKTREAARRARLACERGLSGEFVAVDLRLSLDWLGMLTGEVHNEQMLDLLFNQFCIGK